MSKKTELSTILELVERLKAMQESGAPEEEIEKLSDDIGGLQMNLIVGDLFDEG